MPSRRWSTQKNSIAFSKILYLIMLCRDFFLNPASPLCIYYSFFFCVSMVFLWCVNCVFLYIYVSFLCLFLDSFSSAFLFCLFSFHLTFILIQKDWVYIQVGMWRTGRSGGNNQNILYYHKSIFNKNCCIVGNSSSPPVLQVINLGFLKL